MGQTIRSCCCDGVGAARGCGTADLCVCLNAPHAKCLNYSVLCLCTLGARRCVFGALVAAVDITFILLSRVLKALFRSGVFSDGETACHCRGEFRLSAQPTDNMLGWDGEGRGYRREGRVTAGWRGMGSTSSRQRPGLWAMRMWSHGRDGETMRG